MKLRTLCLLAALAAASGLAVAAPRGAKRPAARLFVQDLKTSSLKWADVRAGDGDSFEAGAWADVPGFKKLDPARQKLVQMSHAGGLVCVGVRDDADGAHESGWVLLRSGVGHVDHGDHGHWSFKKKPDVIDGRLDAKQGNPAHLYRYGGRFFLANDRLNGYTRIDPKEYEGGGKGKPRFLAGGGNHITLAVVDDKVGYSAWIDGGGPNEGRVDVTPVTEQEKSEPAYSFKLPGGGIHGAIANSGKVFFAPSDGVCWVEADPGLRRKGDVKVRHTSLGKDGEKARRTGAFVNHGRHVLFVTGTEESAALVVLDAQAAEPEPAFVPLKVKKGTRAVTPVVATTPEGKAFAFVFHDHVKGADVEDALDVVALSADGRAKVVKTLKVGNSAVDGHYGHHDLAFDADGRFGYFTNPGDGTVSVLS
ncbi:MAG: YncE family protein, partial [Gemmataceae bacterium]